MSGTGLEAPAHRAELSGTPLPALRRRADVQGLRAVAVALVILDHAGVPGFGGGFVGVDVFFVVSGFLISTLLLHEATTTGRVRIGNFYARRARRILPAATVVLVATLAVAAVRLPASRVSDVATDARWAGVFAANYHFAQLGTDYFAQGRATSSVQHFWSLAVEEQFYLCWPVLLLLVVRLARRRCVPWLVALVATAWTASLLWSILDTQRSPVTAYFSSATRAWELATGALLALAGGHLTHLPRWTRHLLVAAGVLAIAAATVYLNAATPFPGWRAMLPVLGAAALLTAGTGGCVGAARLLETRPLGYLGDISYSLYLWHWPVLVLGATYGHRSPERTLALVAVTVVLSVVTFHAVEQPVRRTRRTFLCGARGLALWPVALASVVLAASWSVTHAQHAFAARVATSERSAGPGRSSVPPPHTARTIHQGLAEALRLVDSDAGIPFPLLNYRHLQDDVWHKHFPCFASWDDADAPICPTGDVGSAHTMVVYGDSHAGMWMPPLSTLGKRLGYRVVPLVKLGCGPFDVEQQRYGADYPECGQFRTWALSQIETLHPDVVVLAYRGLWQVEPAPGQSPDDAWAAGVGATLRRLQRLTPTVDVISDVTALGYSPAACISDPQATMASCTVPEREVLRVSNDLTRTSAEALGARYVDVTDLVCQQRRCPLIVDHIVTYHDDSHLTVTWSDVLTDELGRRLGLPRP